jgi:hypothetical protein
VTNGSSFNVTGSNAVDLYFGTVMQFYNTTFISSQNCLGVNWGSKVYLQAGNIFGSCGGSHIYPNSQGQVRVTGSIGISASPANAFVQAQSQGLFVGGAFNIDFVPGINPSFNGLSFVYADTQGQATFGALTINLNGNTVTGTKFKALSDGLIGTGLGNGDLNYFPGSIAGTVGSGGTYDTVMTLLASQLLGSATNDNAAVGYVGEYSSSDITSGAAVALTTGVSANVTSMALPAGDYDVWINTSFKGGATTTVSFIQASISTVSATLDGTDGRIANTFFNGAAPFGSITHIDNVVGPVRLSLSTTTTVYYVAAASFGVSTMAAYGILQWRRRR